MNKPFSFYSTPPLIPLIDTLSLERVGERNIRIVFSVNSDSKINSSAIVGAYSEVSLSIKNKQMVKAKSLLEESQFDWLSETVLAYETLLIFFDDSSIDYYLIVNTLVDLFSKHRAAFSFSNIENQLDAEHLDKLPSEVSSTNNQKRPHIIPVCYCLEGDQYPHDHAEIAYHSGLHPRSIIDIHVAGVYQVFAVGFMPNFAYLGELDKQIHIPRLSEPRRKVPAGAVAIADGQTAIYPRVSPGGWHIIGYTPIDLSQYGDIKFAAGEQVSFKAISEADFHATDRYVKCVAAERGDSA